MTERTPLQRLAEEHGITLDYHDIWGQRHEASEATLRALLAALGALPSPAGDPAAALAAYARARRRQVLPPVCAIHQGNAPLRIPITLPPRAANLALRWRLTEESGAQREGALAWEEMPLAAGSAAGRQTRETREWVLADLPPPGYHRFELLRPRGPLGATTLIVAPDTCYQPEVFAGGGRAWGPAAQLYTLRSERNWGIGDFTDLRVLAEIWADQGADIVGLNPIHALFAGNPAHSSPYGPSSRSLLNVLYIDVEAVAEFAECEEARAQVRSPEFQLRLQGLRATEMVDYEGVAAVKRAILEALFRHFRRVHLDRKTSRGDAFAAFRAGQGEPLHAHGLFEALWQEHHARDPNAWCWQHWPEEYRDPASPAVAAFAAAHAEQIAFFEYLQWQAHLQLEAVGSRCQELGMAIGLYLDFAVSVDGGGADAWSQQAFFANAVSVGAPPDDFSRGGQNWGLPPYGPRRLADAAYAPLVSVLRASMRNAGALRIDHVMGLFRLFWIPAGRPAAEGTYVFYPFDEMLAVLALESQRNRCQVIGEDLGTVPPEVRAAMGRMGILGYRPLLFEKNWKGEYKPPEEIDRNVVVTVTTHDLPTLAGFWEGQDLALRQDLGLFESREMRDAQVVGRAQDRAQLLVALQRAGLLPENANVDPAALPAMTAELATSIQTYLARAPSALMTVQLEDVFGVRTQVNLPGTTTEVYPNWRRKLPLPLEAWTGDGRMHALAAAVAQARGGPAERRRRRRPVDAPIPRSTYRLQLNKSFTFRDAAALVPYLARLGISHIYCSPYLRARPGSHHGYDVTDHNLFNPEIGSREDFDALCAALAEQSMGQIADVVPNHMGVMGRDNQWWLDVLENGPASIFAGYFDIDWLPAKRELHGKVLVPILGAGYGQVLERGEIRLGFDAATGSFSLGYYDHLFPVSPHEYSRLLGHRLAALEQKLGVGNEHLQEFQSLITAFDNLPPSSATSAEKVLQRHRDRELHKRRLARLCQECPIVARHIEDVVRETNGNPQDPASFDALHGLLEAQAYRLADWHAASDEINYRRFFDINDLAALRVEDAAVFDATHHLILQLVAEGKLSGLRIDHPDGLYDPQAYFQRLQQRVAVANNVYQAHPASDAVFGERAIYVVVEKILAAHERLPDHWPVHGTTGYDALNLINGVFVAPKAARRMLRFYSFFIGERVDLDDLIYQCKRSIMRHALASELTVLANELNRISEANRHTRDFTLNRLRQALTELAARLPVYRTYVRDGEVSAVDQRHIEWAVGRCRKRSRATDVGIYDFVGSVLLQQPYPGESAEQRARKQHFAMKFQQFSGPVMAKGLEDTVLYRFFPLASLNEVGSHPDRLGVSVQAFHNANLERQRRWPHAMLASSTHDTKRSEDVRARINVLSELDKDWRSHLRRWSRCSRALRSSPEGDAMPSRNDEYLLYQTLAGTWPLEEMDPDAHRAFIDRIEAYMVKAAREAKRHTSWAHVDAEYEQALSQFVRSLLDRSERNLFLADFLPFQRRVARLGMFASLSQTLLKLTMPGVPDIYQGNDLWDFSLVDPDNRRPVDYEKRWALLEDLEIRFGRGSHGRALQARALLDDLPTGEAKLFLTWASLGLRRARAELFRDGTYVPLRCAGARADHLIAYARTLGDATAITIAPRFFAALCPDDQSLPLGPEAWGDTSIDLSPLEGSGPWHDTFSGANVPEREIEGAKALLVAEAASQFPVALLVRG